MHGAAYRGRQRVEHGARSGQRAERAVGADDPPAGLIGGIGAGFKFGRKRG